MQIAVWRSLPVGRVIYIAVAVMLVGLLHTAAAYASGENAELRCPPATESSPGFRSYLPDCRAYEQVTPAFKDGTDLEFSGLAANGESLIVAGLGGFAGVESGSNSSDGPVYKLTRSGVGWAVEAIMPPASLFPASLRVSAASGLDRTLWIARTASESTAAENLYIREADGPMVEVGPLVPPGTAAGPSGGEAQPWLYNTLLNVLATSADLQDVFFTVFGGRSDGLAWGGDTTIGGGSITSLYEYTGEGQSRPELVGVSDGSTVVSGENEGKALPAGRLISSCGTALGAFGNQELYNAVSASGETVYFTSVAGPCVRAETGEGPEVNELYARVGGQTVPISEPGVLFCSSCQEGSRVGAAFAGASEDGSKAFFLTSQELLPGTAGMNLYEYDFDSSTATPSEPNGRITLVSHGAAEADVQGVARVSEDGSHVYFVAGGVLTGANREGAAPVEGADNLYVFERDSSYPGGRLAFVATLSAADEQDWSATDERPVQATPDGQFLVFDSRADLPSGGPELPQQVYEYDAGSEELVRVSRGANNDLAAGDQSANEDVSGVQLAEFGKELVDHAEPQPVAVSEDGGSVLFQSRAALTLGVQAKGLSAYEFDSPVGEGGTLSEGDVYLIVPESSADTAVVGLDEGGGDAFVRSQLALVPQDGDSGLDVYDARVDGGFAAPDPPAGCVAPVCEGTLYSQPVVVVPGSASTVGSGGGAAVVAPSVPQVVSTVSHSVPAVGVKCRKHFVRRKGKCYRQKRKVKDASRRGRR